MLFAQSLDTNADLTRFVVDGWLEISFPDNNTGQEVMFSVQRLRSTWVRLLKLRFDEIKDKQDRSATRRNRELDLESHLAKKLSEFLDSNVTYSLRRLLPSESRYLYLGPLGQSQNDDRLEDASGLPFTGSLEPHPTKGGFRVSDYLTYSCLQDTVMAEAASAAAQYIAKHWRCEKCGQKMLVTVLERLRHEEECQNEQAHDSNDPVVESHKDKVAVNPSIERLRKSYYCNTCQSQFSFTSTEILKHKKSHLSST